MSDDDRAPRRFGRPRAEALHAVLLDMGGVVLDLGEGGGLPWGELERRGREDLLALIAETGGRASDADLDRLLFTPWRRMHDRRYRLGREAAWRPHVERLGRVTGSEVAADRLLSAWAGPYLGSLRTLSGVQETLARLSAAHLSLALVSNVPLPGRYFEHVLEEQGVAAFFRSRHFSYDAGTRKPAPGLVRAAMEGLGVESEATVFVGDRRSTDMAAGRAADVTTVWVRSRDTDGPEPDAEIGSLAELPELLGI